MNIVVLSGGISTERTVSLTTGAKVQNALVENGHHAILADVYMGYELQGTVEETFEKATVPAVVEQITEIVPDIEAIKKSRGGNPDIFFGKNILDLCIKADIVFMALHGENGENGRLQAAFDLLGIKYTGCGYMASAVAMHKNLTKQILLSCNVLTPKGKMIKKGENVTPTDIGSFPFVIKPCCGGSSIGVSIVNNEDEFKKAVCDAFSYEDEILAEEYIKGREFSVGILGGKALPAIEIVPKEGFYDYKNKYQAGLTEEFCPADISPEIEKLLGDCAVAAFNALGLYGYARIDFILTEDNRAYCLEANTLPGMTPTSLLPQEAMAAGISYNELCEKIIEVSMGM